MTKTTQKNLSKEQLLFMKNQELKAKKDKALRDEFNHKLEELSEWGYEHNIIVDAFLKADHKGIIPYISFVEMSEDEIKQYAGWKKTQIKTDIELKKVV